MDLTSQTFEGERLVGILAVLGVIGYFFVRFLKAVLSRPLRPDPWDEQVSADLAEGNGIPICHRCLAPHGPLQNFCADCGAPVGEYTNWLPYPYLFSLGHTLRIGTSDTFRRSPLTVAGFILLSLVEYAVLAPFYWIRLFLNISHQHSSAPPADEISGTDPE
jgi:hypothetical protein